MAAGELEVVVLIPMLQAQVGQGCRVGKLEVREMPVEYLTILGG